MLRESDEETSDVPSSPEALPVSEKLLFSMKSDAVVRPEDSTEISANTNDISPSSNSSEDLPLLPVNNTRVPADEAENDSDVELHETGSPEATTTTNTGGTLDGTRSETSEQDGVPKLRFCLPGKHGARGDRLRMWGRKHKRKRRPQQKSPSDLELTATNSMSPLRPHGTSQCSDIEEQPRVFDVRIVDMGTEETGHSDQQHENVRSTDKITSEINQSATQLPLTNSSDAHPANNIAGDKNLPIFVVSPVVEESSHWDFDMSSDHPNDSNDIDKDSSVTTKAEDVASSGDPNLARSPSVASSSLSIWDVPSPENNIFPESGNQHLSASNDSGNTRNSKPKSSRFTVFLS